MIFFVLHFALRHYCSKGFALLPFKNGVKIAAIEGVAQYRSSSRSQRSGVSLPWSRNRWRCPRTDKARQSLQKAIFDENHSVYWSKSVALPDHSRTCVSRTSPPDLVQKIWMANNFFFQTFFYASGNAYYAPMRCGRT